MTIWRFAAAVIGLAVALAIAPHLQRRAAPGELPGAMQAMGLDPSGPMIEFGFIVIVTFAAAYAATGFSPSRHALKPVATSRRLHEVVLLATLLPLYFAFLDAFRGDPRWLLVAAAVVIAALRFFVPATAFALAPLAIVFQMYSLPAVIPLAWILVTPLLLRRIDTRRVVPWTYAIFAFAYPLALLGVNTPPYLDFFEDGHELVVAHELREGERPYADIVPVHGLLSDGGVDAAIGGSAADILRARRVISALNLVAIYAVVFATTGSAGLGLLAVFLAIALVPSATIWLRTIPALFALAATAVAVRLRSRRWLVVAGALVVIAFLFGMEFAVYSGIVTIAAAARMRSLAALFVGVVGASVVVTIFFAFGHFATPFVLTTLFELLPAGRVYVPDPLHLPSDHVMLAIWMLALVFAAAMTRGPLRRSDGAWLIAMWSVAAGLSYAQRGHMYAAFVLPAFVVVLVWSIARYDRRIAAVLAIAIVVIAHPFDHIFHVATPLRLSGGVQHGRNRIVAGVVVPPEVASGVVSAARFVGQSLPPGATWFDFSNSPSLYYLLDRRCPTRHHQVPFYETEDEQLAVIAALERDRSVRAALIACPGGDAAIDGVPNRVRAPLVWQYLQTHFVPAYDSAGVVFWLRRAI